MEAVLRALALLALALLAASPKPAQALLALLVLLALALSATLPVRRTLRALLALLSITLLHPTSWDVQYCRSSMTGHSRREGCVVTDSRPASNRVDDT